MLGIGALDAALAAAVLALTVSAAALRHRGFRGSTGLPAPPPEHPCEVAYLAASSRREAYVRAVGAGLLSLVDRGVVRVTSVGEPVERRFAVELLRERAPEHPVERAVYDLVAAHGVGVPVEVGRAGLVVRVRPVVASVERRQRRAGFIVTARQHALIRIVPAGLFLAGMLLPVAAGLLDAPVGVPLLVLAAPVDLALAAVWVRHFLPPPAAHRTWRGDRILAALREGRSGLPPPGPAQAMGLYGRDALVHSTGLRSMLHHMGVD